MAKESGITSTLTVDDATPTGRAITNDVQSFSYQMPKNLQDVTGLDKSAMERIQLLGDFTCTINGVFNDASNMSHDVFKTVQSSSATRTVVFVVSGQTLTAEVLFTDYPLTRGADGSLTYAVPGSLADGTAPAWT